MDGVFYEANGKAYWNLSAAGGGVLLAELLAAKGYFD